MGMHKKWTKKLFILITVSIVLIGLLNVLIDPYGVFGRNPNSCSEPNERYVKMTYLSNHPDAFDGFLMGSSRIGSTEPSLLKNHFPKNKFYNLTISAGTLGEFEEMIETMIKARIKPRVIYLQIDVYDNLLTYKNERSKLLLRMKPENSLKEKIAFFKDYLLLLPNNTNTIQQMKLDLGIHKRSSRYDFYSTGCWYADAKEKNIRQNPLLYVKNEETFHKFFNKTIPSNQIVMMKNLESLRKIKQLSYDNNIQLILFVTPHNHKMLDAIGMHAYKIFLQSLAEVTEYWDFSGYNSVTVNDLNYYEYSHYRPHVAKWIVSRIFKDTNTSIPDDFGVYVSKKNILKHLENIEQKNH